MVTSNVSLFSKTESVVVAILAKGHVLLESVPANL